MTVKSFSSWVSHQATNNDYYTLCWLGLNYEQRRQNLLKSNGSVTETRGMYREKQLLTVLRNMVSLTLSQDDDESLPLPSQ